MKKTRLALRRATIYLLTSKQLPAAAGGRWHDPGPTEEACDTQRYCDHDTGSGDPYTTDCNSLHTC